MCIRWYPIKCIRINDTDTKKRFTDLNIPTPCANRIDFVFFDEFVCEHFLSSKMIDSCKEAKKITHRLDE